jgi:hypothetical protein
LTLRGRPGGDAPSGGLMLMNRTASAEVGDSHKFMKAISSRSRMSNKKSSSTAFGEAPDDNKFKNVSILTPIETCVKLLKQLMENGEFQGEVRDIFDECIELLSNGGYNEGLVVEHGMINEADVHKDISFLQNVEMGPRVYNDESDVKAPSIASRLKNYGIKDKEQLKKAPSSLTQDTFKPHKLSKSKDSHTKSIDHSIRNMNLGARESTLAMDDLTESEVLLVNKFENWNFNIFEFQQKLPDSNTVLR